MINLLITGYHGYGNCGDEATLMAMTQNIKAMAEDVEITAISYKPEITKTEYNINSIQRFNIPALLNAIMKSDILVSGGGTLIQNSTSTRSLMYYLSIISFAKLLKKRVMLYGNGIGPVYGKFSRKMVKKVLNKADIITLREEYSLEELRNIGVIKPEMHVTADAAFTMQPLEKEKSIELLKKEGVPIDKEIIGVSVRNWNRSADGEKYILEIARACDEMAKRGKTILIIPMQMPKDMAISKRLMRTMKEKSFILKNEYTPTQIAGIIGCLALTYSMRLHTLLFSAIQGVPMLGVVYESKVLNYLDVLDMPMAGDIRKESLSADKMINQLEGMFYDLEKYRCILREKADILIENARMNDKLLNTQLDIIRKKKK